MKITVLHKIPGASKNHQESGVRSQANRPEKELVAEFGPAFGELGLKAGDDAGMHLADARFAQVERGADLFHGHVFVIVEDDDESLVAVETACH